MLQPWFAEAKLGIFLHWGIYAVNGVTPSWPLFNGEMDKEEYFSQFGGFSASAYDPTEWAGLFRRAGARYAVLTAKHHDGVALWDTALSDLNVAGRSPAERDLVEPYCRAMREAGLKVGLYFSHLDWSHPDYAAVAPPWPRERWHSFHSPVDGIERPEGWRRFLEFHRGQLGELMTHYGKIDLLWFDGEWERAPEMWDFAGLKEYLHSLNPEVVLNSRLAGHGDYETPEQGVPIVPPPGAWEFCMTANDNWGFKPTDRNWKTPRQIARIFCECLGMGGNLLLGIGPKEDGTFAEEAVILLETLGDWIRRHEEAVYPVVRGLPFGHFFGPNSLSQNGEALYLYLFHNPLDEIDLKGVRNAITRISVLHSGEELNHYRRGGAAWLGIPGVTYISPPTQGLDPMVTVLKVELEGPVDYYHGSGGAVERN